MHCVLTDTMHRYVLRTRYALWGVWGFYIISSLSEAQTYRFYFSENIELRSNISTKTTTRKKFVFFFGWFVIYLIIFLRFCVLSFPSRRGRFRGYLKALAPFRQYAKGYLYQKGFYRHRGYQ